MKKLEKIELMAKYNVRSCGGGVFAEGFIEGLAAAASSSSRRKIKIEEVCYPDQSTRSVRTR